MKKKYVNRYFNIALISAFLSLTSIPSFSFANEDTHSSKEHPEEKKESPAPPQGEHAASKKETEIHETPKPSHKEIEPNKHPSNEQGEEIYAPEEKTEILAEPKKEEKEEKEAPPAKKTTLGHKGKTTEKVKLKEFTKKNQKKNETEIKPEESKSNLTPIEEPETPAAGQETKEEHQDDAKEAKEHPKEEIEKLENEKAMKVENNKLVDPDSVIVDEKKHNGIYWFFGVFITLLIVIFAFT